MPMRKLPPTTASASTFTGFTGAGANHFPIHSASVQARKTFSRRARKVRSTTTLRFTSCPAGLFIAGLFQEALQRIKAGFPEPLVLVQPLRRAPQGRSHQP